MYTYVLFILILPSFLKYNKARRSLSSASSVNLKSTLFSIVQLGRKCTISGPSNGKKDIPLVTLEKIKHSAQYNKALLVNVSYITKAI